MREPTTGASGAEPSPRFAAGGHDAETFGASRGYPTGDRETFTDVGSLVGSHSHLDEIFPARSRGEARHGQHRRAQAAD